MDEQIAMELNESLKISSKHTESMTLFTIADRERMVEIMNTLQKLGDDVKHLERNTNKSNHITTQLLGAIIVKSQEMNSSCNEEEISSDQQSGTDDEKDIRSKSVEDYESSKNEWKTEKRKRVSNNSRTMKCGQRISKAQWENNYCCRHSRKFLDGRWVHKVNCSIAEGHRCNICDFRIDSRQMHPKKINHMRNIVRKRLEYRRL